MRRIVHGRPGERGPYGNPWVVGSGRVLGCDIAVSVTGIAGPGGAEPGKPVGTVWFGISSTRGAQAHHRLFPGNRDEVREQAVLFALSLLGEEIAELSRVR